MRHRRLETDAEYNADAARTYIHGQNPSGSGALYLASKYPEMFAAVVVSSGPIVYDTIGRP